MGLPIMGHANRPRSAVGSEQGGDMSRLERHRAWYGFAALVAAAVAFGVLVGSYWSPFLPTAGSTESAVGHGDQIVSGSLIRFATWAPEVAGASPRDHIVSFLSHMGPLGILWWQWIALLLLILVAWSAGAVLSRITTAAFARMVRRTATRLDDLTLPRLHGPLALGWAILAADAILPFIELTEETQAVGYVVLKAALLVAIFWLLFRMIRVAAEVVALVPAIKDRPSALGLIPLGVRATQVFVLAIATITVISQMGYPVASLVAGLGIGGIAFALAAQKTVENLFGAVSLGVDQPFRQGDFVKVDDISGTVETIGLRSTRFRTLDRTLVTLPNGQLSEKRIESLTARDRLRLFCQINLVYATTEQQMREILSKIEKTLREHSMIWPDDVIVRFTGFGDSSLNVEATAWFQTTDWYEFQSIRQDIFLEIMRVVERSGSKFAMPTRTIHVAEAGR